LEREPQVMWKSVFVGLVVFFFFAIKRKQHMPKKQNKTKQKHHKNVFKVGLLKVGLEAWLKCRTLT
jgi:preprotein translocase subunit YajC